MENRIKELETMVSILESRLAETRTELAEQKLFVQKILGTSVPISEQYEQIENYYYDIGTSYFDGIEFHFFL